MNASRLPGSKPGLVAALSVACCAHLASAETRPHFDLPAAPQADTFAASDDLNVFAVPVVNNAIDRLDLLSSCTMDDGMRMRLPVPPISNQGAQPPFMVAMSADGSRIACLDAATSQYITVIDAASGATTTMNVPPTPLNDYHIGGLNISRDGQYVAYAMYYAPGSNITSIELHRTPSDHVGLITDAPVATAGLALVDSGGMLPVSRTPLSYISDDGSVLAYMGQSNVWIGGVLVPIASAYAARPGSASGPVELTPGADNIDAVALSGDGHRVLLSAAGPIAGCSGAVAGATAVIATLTIDDNLVPSTCTTVASVTGVAGNADLAISRDGYLALWASNGNYAPTDPAGAPTTVEIFSARLSVFPTTVNRLTHATGGDFDARYPVSNTVFYGPPGTGIDPNRSDTRFAFVRYVGTTGFDPVTLMNTQDDNPTFPDALGSNEDPDSPFDIVNATCSFLSWTASCQVDVREVRLPDPADNLLVWMGRADSTGAQSPDIGTWKVWSFDGGAVAGTKRTIPPQNYPLFYLDFNPQNGFDQFLTRAMGTGEQLDVREVRHAVP